MRPLVFLCAAVAGFGITLERPSDRAEARRRGCCYQYQYSGNYCQTGYQTYGHQTNWYQNGYQNQYVNQCGQNYGQPTGQEGQNQSASPGGETAPPPAPAPMPDNRSTYYRGANPTPETRREGAAVQPPPPPRDNVSPAPRDRRSPDYNSDVPAADIPATPPGPSQTP